jgi:hypothetical protein
MASSARQFRRDRGKLDRELVTRTHQALLPHYTGLRATGGFGSSTPAPRDADPQTAFLCFTGRQP